MRRQICKQVYLQVISTLVTAAVMLAVITLTILLVFSVKDPTGDITLTVYPMLSGR